MALLTEQQLLRVLVKEAKKSGTQTALAQRFRVSPSYLNDVLRGNRNISWRIADQLGYRQVIMFQRKSS